jgi:uncharacterized delta-60 repeat protein
MWFLSSRKTRRSQTSRPAGRPRLEVLEDRCLLSAGGLDPTFNPTGSPPGTATVVIGQADGAHAVLAQPSGKIVLVGESTDSKAIPHFTLAEFDPNGSLDPNFGSGGTVVTPKGSITPYRAYAGVLYPTGSSGDQKIVAVGFGSTEFALVRYNADGSLDTSFGNGGYVGTSFKQGRGNSTYGVALVPNGTSPPKIVMAGNSAGNAGLEMARYNPDGSLDTTFGSKGTVYMSGIGEDALALDPVSGDLIVGGLSGQLAAFRPNGTLDTSFGNNGLVNTGIGTTALAIYPAADTAGNAGKIVIGGGKAIARYNVNGTPDTSWGGTGVVPDPTAANVESAAIQADDKVVVACGWSVARFNNDGSLDSSFGSGGVSSSRLPGAIPVDHAVTVEANGDIVEAGTTMAGSPKSVFGVARFLPSEPEVGSFTASPNPVASGTVTTLSGSGLTDANPGATISQVAFYLLVNNSQTLLGYGTNNNGTWSYSYDTTGLATGSYTLYAQATDSYGVTGDPTALTLTVQ